jgi:hypothetical protein
MWIYIACFMAGSGFGFFISGLLIASKMHSELTLALDEVPREDFYGYIRGTKTGDQPVA